MVSPSHGWCGASRRPCCLLVRRETRAQLRELSHACCPCQPLPASSSDPRASWPSLHTSSSAYHSHKVIPGTSSVKVGCDVTAGEQVRLALDAKQKLSAESGGERRALSLDPHSL